MEKVKRKKSIWLSFLLSVSVMAAATGIIPFIPVSAAATTYLFQDFDHVAADVKISAGTAGTFVNDESAQGHGGTNAAWGRASGTNGAMEVINDINNPGNNYLALTTTDASTNFVANFTNSAINNMVVFECRVKTPVSSETGCSFVTVSNATSSNNFIMLKIFNNSIKDGLASDNTLISSLSPDTWYYLRATIDTSSTSSIVRLTCGTQYDHPTQMTAAATFKSGTAGAAANQVKASPKLMAAATKTMYMDEVKLYTAPGDKNNMLASLALNPGGTTVFDASRTTYPVALGSLVAASVTVTPTLWTAGGTITVNGQTVASGSASSAISIGPIPTAITIIVTPSIEGPSLAYTITLSRSSTLVMDYGMSDYSETITSPGNWGTSSIQGYKGSSTRVGWPSNTGAIAVKWSPNNTYSQVAGMVDVYFWKVMYSDCTNNATVKVVHNGKTDIFTINLNGNISGSGFVYLGTFDFAGTIGTSEYVSAELSGGTSGLRVDSVKFTVPAYSKVVDGVAADITATGFSSGNIKCEREVTNYSGSTQNVTVVIVLYNKATNTVEDIDITEDSLESGQNKTLSSGIVTVPVNYTDYKIKAFYWEDLAAMKPLLAGATFQ